MNIGKEISCSYCAYYDKNNKCRNERGPLCGMTMPHNGSCDYSEPKESDGFVTIFEENK